MSLRISFENILIEILGTCTDSGKGDLMTYLLVLVRWTPGQEVWIWDLACCVVFLGKELYFHSACHHPGV